MNILNLMSKSETISCPIHVRVIIQGSSRENPPLNPFTLGEVAALSIEGQELAFHFVSSLYLSGLFMEKMVSVGESFINSFVGRLQPAHDSLSNSL